MVWGRRRPRKLLLSPKNLTNHEDNINQIVKGDENNIDKSSNSKGEGNHEKKDEIINETKTLRNGKQIHVEDQPS